MRIPEYLEKDRFLYAGFIQLFLRGTAQIIEEAPDGFFVKDTRSGVYMFAADNGAAAERIISKHKDEPCRIAVAAKAEGDGSVAIGTEETIDLADLFLRIRTKLVGHVHFLASKRKSHNFYLL